MVIAFDGPVAESRIEHDPLAWAADKEQLTIHRIAEPFLEAAVAMPSGPLRQVRTGLHGTGDAAEMRFVFDFADTSAKIQDIRIQGHVLTIDVR